VRWYVLFHCGWASYFDKTAWVNVLTVFWLVAALPWRAGVRATAALVGVAGALIAGHKKESFAALAVNYSMMIVLESIGVTTFEQLADSGGASTTGPQKQYS
jgi:hypothetical protein